MYICTVHAPNSVRKPHQAKSHGIWACESRCGGRRGRRLARALSEIMPGVKLEAPVLQWLGEMPLAASSSFSFDDSTPHANPNPKKFNLPAADRQRTSKGTKA